MKTKTNEKWEDGKWLKGMNLSGSQTEYILGIIRQLLSSQKREIEKEWLAILEKKENHYKLREKLVIKAAIEDYRQSLKEEIGKKFVEWATKIPYEELIKLIEKK